MFKEGKQKELLEKEKLEISWPAFAIHFGIKYGKLQSYLYEGILISDKLFNKLSVKKEFNKYILEERSDNWGRSAGGKSLHAGFVKKIKSPEESERLAELYGIMLGDGNMTKLKSYKVGTYQIRIVGDSRHDKEYLINYVKPLIKSLFKIDVYSYKAKNINALYLSATGRKLVEFWESKGFKPGNKITNQLEIPNWIKQNTRFLKACIRGLYDTDGSIYKLTNQNSYQICLTNYNNTLLNQVRESLISLEINPSKITKGRDLLITKKSELRKFLNEIGFRNSRHLDKVKMWKKALWSSGQ